MVLINNIENFSILCLDIKKEYYPVKIFFRFTKHTVCLSLTWKILTLPRHFSFSFWSDTWW